jgi:hypothetical protein
MRAWIASGSTRGGSPNTGCAPTSCTGSNRSAPFLLEQVFSPPQAGCLTITTVHTNVCSTTAFHWYCWVVPGLAKAAGKRGRSAERAAHSTAQRDESSPTRVAQAHTLLSLLAVAARGESPPLTQALPGECQKRTSLLKKSFGIAPTNSVRVPGAV